MELEPIARLSRDLKSAAKTLSDDEARFLVDAYYMMQEDRKRANNQVRALEEAVEPHDVIGWLAAQSDTLEKQIKRALDAYSGSSPVGEWARSVVGIGPVIAAGLLAHIDIEKAPTVGHIWRFAGLDPTTKWNKGEKRPWNAGLKVLCWKIGESFVKVSGNPAARYGAIYVERKAYESAKNERRDYADQAERILTEKKIGKTTEAFKHYSEGRLPPAHIHARAKRYAVKLFLAHYHHTAYVDRFGTEPPLPYAIALQGHAHHMKP